jgi:tRNA pseudouridine65 synthase
VTESIQIIYEDDSIVVVNKPNNILVYASYFARNIKDDDLVTLLKEQTERELYPIHRLDRKTSGILLLAKEKEFVKDYQQQFENNLVQKQYYAVVRGHCPSNGIIDTPTKNAETGKYKEALTEYETLETIELDIPVHPYEKSRYSLVKFTPKTGRMHQLRIHANKISHPIVGDYQYGDRFHNRMFENEFNWNNMFLHAGELSIKQPNNGEQLLFKSSFPDDWDQLFKNFNWPKPK